MSSLFRLSLRFLKNSRMLTISAFISVFIACFLGTGIFQLAANVETSIYDTVKAEYESYAQENPDISEDMLSVMIQNEAQDFFEALNIVFKTLYIITVSICGVFIVSIFNEFLKKYLREMAIIRVIGGKTGQIDILFSFMSLIITTAACITSGILSAVLDKFLLNYINDKYAFFDGSFVMKKEQFFIFIFITFVLVNFIVIFIFWLNQDVMPIQIFQKTASGLKRRKISNLLLFSRKIIGTDGYISFKLMFPKLRQIILIIFLIALTTMITYFGKGFIPVLYANNNAYYTELLCGADAVIEVSANDDFDLSNIINNVLKRCDDKNLICNYTSDDNMNASFYIDGEHDAIKDVMKSVKIENEDYIYGYIYDDVMEDSRKKMTQISALINIVTGGFLIVIGIGWLNSVKEILISRKREYHIMRLIGMSERRVRKICIIQILTYMLIGIIAGIIAGHIALCKIFEGQLIADTAISFGYGNVIIITIYFMLLAFFLRKTIKEVSC